MNEKGTILFLWDTFTYAVHLSLTMISKHKIQVYFEHKIILKDARFSFIMAF